MHIHDIKKEVEKYKRYKKQKNTGADNKFNSAMSGFLKL